MTKSRQSLSFKHQATIDVRAVSIEWRPANGPLGEIRLTSFDREGLDLPSDSRLWMQAKSTIGLQKKCLGNWRNPNHDITIALDEEFVQETSVKVYITSADTDRRIIASVNKPIPLVDSRTGRSQNLLARRRVEGLGVGIPWKIEFRPTQITLLLNSDWDGIVTETDSDWFNALVMGDVLRQIAIEVGNKDSELLDDVREAWLRCFTLQFLCSNPPSYGDSDTEYQKSLVEWADEVAKKVAEKQHFKQLYDRHRRADS